MVYIIILCSAFLTNYNMLRPCKTIMRGSYLFTVAYSQSLYLCTSHFEYHNIHYLRGEIFSEVLKVGELLS